MPRQIDDAGSKVLVRKIEDLGVHVTAVRRRGIRAVDPTPDTRFIDGDVVVILGVPAEIARAEERLLQGK